MMKPAQSLQQAMELVQKQVRAAGRAYCRGACSTALHVMTWCQLQACAAMQQSAFHPCHVTP